MNANAQKWVTALRSGDYDQATCQLRDHANGFCCLGVLCEVFRKETGTGHWVEIDTERSDRRARLYFEVSTTDTSDTVCPRAVQAWAGLRVADGNFDDDYLAHCLVDMNDSGECGFDEIADTIASEPEHLFGPAE